MTMRPVHPAAFERMPDLYSIPEDANTAIDNNRQPRSLTRPSTAGAADASPYPMYPGLQTPNMDRTRSMEATPTLNRPRKLSGTADHSLPGVRSQGPVGLRTRSPSWGGGLSYDQVDPLSWRSNTLQSQTHMSLRKQKSRARLGNLFNSLPGEVLDVILEKLQELHLNKESESCATCWMRDVCNIAVCSQKWSKAARLAL